MKRENVLSWEAAEALRLEASDLSVSEADKLRDKVAAIQVVIEGYFSESMAKEIKERVRNLPERVMVVDRDVFEQFFYHWEGDEQSPVQTVAVDVRQAMLSELGARYYTSVIAQKLGLTIFASREEKEMISAYGQLVEKYGESVHRLYFGSSKVSQSQRKEILTEFEGEAAEKFKNEWGYGQKIDGGEPEFNANVFGAEYTNGNLIVLRKAEPYWESLGELGRRVAIDILGSEEQAKKAYTDAIFNYYLIHEVLHAYEGD